MEALDMRVRREQMDCETSADSHKVLARSDTVVSGSRRTSERSSKTGVKLLKLIQPNLPPKEKRPDGACSVRPGATY